MSIQSVKAFFQQLDLNLPIIELEVSTATVALAAEAHGVEPGQYKIGIEATIETESKTIAICKAPSA